MARIYSRVRLETTGARWGGMTPWAVTRRRASLFTTKSTKDTKGAPQARRPISNDSDPLLGREAPLRVLSVLRGERRRLSRARLARLAAPPLSGASRVAVERRYRGA